MQTKFEHYATTNLLGGRQSPPRYNGKLQFKSEWESRAFGLALALSKAGYFEWEQFQQALIQTIAEWEEANELDDPSWNYYERWLLALELVVRNSGLIASEEAADRVAEIREGSYACQVKRNDL
ncbi:nitrile hydratase accessory protein [Marinobacter shengliensis]|uniref:nitrile hydratase accessory protein n=1 Tax=Marinobacter shengliensis TaxID=1389223 RepID=UPI001E57B560|nr:nitrile hydratase accessory protein [Marinobacter shengliensis]MCD1630573.1 nitrile hydratase accessory protein [Marinobacter shengliensis]